MKWLIGVVLIALALWAFSCEMQRVGGLKAEIKVLVEANDTLKKRVDSLLRVYQKERATLRLRNRNYVALRDSVLRLGTSVPDAGTIPRLIAAADSTIAACTDALRTCDERDAIKSQLIRNQQAQIDKLLKQRPNFFTRTGGKLVWFGAGMIAGKLILK